MRNPAFNGELLSDNDKSLQWLAHRIVNDSRFPKATVEFWWSAVMGAELLSAPENDADADFNEKLARFESQQATIKELAKNFKENNLNFKSLLADMVMSPWFSADAIDPNIANTAILRDLGRGQLLTPEKISRKVRALMGQSWNQRPSKEFLVPGLIADNLTVEWDFRSFIGGIDSFAVTQRPRELNVSMYNVIMRQAGELATPFAIIEFLSPEEKRVIFKGISVDDIPTDPSKELLFRKKLAELHFMFWGDDVATDSAAIDNSFELLTNLYLARKEENRIDVYESPAWIGNKDTGQWGQAGEDLCDCDPGMDYTFMKGTWSGMIKYFMSHYKFVSE